MRYMPSSEFRRVYASLTEPVIVTVSGHPIGKWTPLRPDVSLKSTVTIQSRELASVNVRDQLAGFGQSRPAPKPGKR